MRAPPGGFYPPGGAPKLPQPCAWALAKAAMPIKKPPRLWDITV